MSTQHVKYLPPSEYRSRVEALAADIIDTEFGSVPRTDHLTLDDLQVIVHCMDTAPPDPDALAKRTPEQRRQDANRHYLEMHACAELAGCDDSLDDMYRAMGTASG